MDKITTSDGQAVRVGSRVFTTDGEYGTIQDIDSTGWAAVTLESGRRSHYNGDRLSIRKPFFWSSAEGAR
jgi:hypothetical protein